MSNKTSSPDRYPRRHLTGVGGTDDGSQSAASRENTKRFNGNFSPKPRTDLHRDSDPDAPRLPHRDSDVTQPAASDVHRVPIASNEIRKNYWARRAVAVLGLVAAASAVGYGVDRAGIVNLYGQNTTRVAVGEGDVAWNVAEAAQEGLESAGASPDIRDIVDGLVDTYHPDEGAVTGIDGQSLVTHTDLTGPLGLLHGAFGGETTDVEKLQMGPIEGLEKSQDGSIPVVVLNGD